METTSDLRTTESTTQAAVTEASPAAPAAPPVEPPDRLRLSLDLPRQPSPAQYAQIVRQFARDIAALPPALAGIAPFQRERLGLAVEAALYAELKQLGV
jgi:hypothetical protein